MPGGPTVAVIAPHAGLMFSGPVGAYACKAAAGGPFDTVILAGPPFVPSARSYAHRPVRLSLGPAAIDERLGAG